VRKVPTQILTGEEIEHHRSLAAIRFGESTVNVERVEDPPGSLWLTAQTEEGMDTSITYWAEVHKATEVVAEAKNNRLRTTWKVQCSVGGLLGGAKVEFHMDKGAYLPVGGVILKFDASPAE